MKFLYLLALVGLLSGANANAQAKVNSRVKAKSGAQVTCTGTGYYVVSQESAAVKVEIFRHGNKTIVSVKLNGAAKSTYRWLVTNPEFIGNIGQKFENYGVFELDYFTTEKSAVLNISDKNGNDLNADNLVCP